MLHDLTEPTGAVQILALVLTGDGQPVFFRILVSKNIFSPSYAKKTSGRGKHLKMLWESGILTGVYDFRIRWRDGFRCGVRAGGLHR